MMMNPIYERERRASSRSARFAAVMTVFNALLAAAALSAIWYTLHRIVETGELRYSVFLTMFRRLAWVEFAAVLVMMPALTAGSISGEREKKTLELILTTRMRPAEIVAGKLLSAISKAAVFLLTGAPVFAAVLLFGGVRLKDLCLLYLLILLTACFSAGIGMFFSAVSKRTPVAAAASYAVLAALAIVPAAVFSRALSAVTGQTGALEEMLLGMGMSPRVLLSPAIVPAGCLLLAGFTALFLFASAFKISPHLHKHRHLGAFSFF